MPRIELTPMVREFLGPLTGRLIHRVLIELEEHTESTFVFAGYTFSFALEQDVLTIWMVA